MQSSALVSRQRLLRLLLVVGAAIGVALTVLEASGTSGLSFYRELPGMHRCEASCDDSKCERSLQGPWEGFAMPARLPESQNYEVRPLFRGNKGPEMEHHRPRHHKYDKESDDDDDSKDDKDDEEDSDSSDSGSQSDSDSGSQSGGIQSSAITRLGGVNIGNTITIINVGGAGALPSGSQEGSGPSGGVPSNSIPPAGNGVGRAAISAAAVRAFCDSMGCGPGKIFQGSLAGSSSTTFSMATSTNTSSGFGGSAAGSSSGSGATRNEAKYANSAKHNGSSILPMRAAKWLVLVAILVQINT